jgi:hypothetical protein
MPANGMTSAARRPEAHSYAFERGGGDIPALCTAALGAGHQIDCMAFDRRSRRWGNRSLLRPVCMGPVVVHSACWVVHI